VSYSVDVNVLLYASDRKSENYAAAILFLESRPSDPDIFCLFWPTLLSYLRMSTHPKLFSHPLSPQEAVANIEALLNLPRVRVLSETEAFLAVYREVTQGFPVRGNLVPDAHLATLLKQHDVRRLYTSDADFRKFTFLEVIDPFKKI
jgi:toxin-antitoxin system PIN domain toxin